MFRKVILALLAVTIVVGCASNPTEKRLSNLFLIRSADSIVVSRYPQIDTLLIFPRTIEYPSYDSEYSYDDTRECEDPFKNPSFRLVFTHEINGYKVSADIFPNKNWGAIGVLRMRLQKGSERYIVEDSFYWDLNLLTDWKYNSEQYGKTIQTDYFSDKFVQEDGEIINDESFCFKDVDFDGVKELCIKQSGYNRYYFSVHKLAGGKATVLTDEPYNNIVYGEYDLPASTTFDYENSQIRIDEQMGCSVSIEKLFCKNESSEGPAMLLEYDEETTFAGNRVIISRWRKDQEDSETHIYQLPEGEEISIYYTAVKHNKYSLDSIVCSFENASRKMYPDEFSPVRFSEEK